MLTLQNTEAIRRIEEAIGYTFNDKRLLIQVLTRKTYLKIDPEAPDNEVLEFYGDTLMNYHVTNYFMSKYAHMLDDGLFFMRTVEQFTDMRSHYVCNRYLTDRIKAMGLARYLRAQNRDAELRRDGEKAYADIFESLVGAIYLDSYQNDTLIRAFILRQLGIESKRLPADIEAFDYDSLTLTPLATPLSADVSEVALEEPETEADLPAEEIPVQDEIPAVTVVPVEEVETSLPPVEAVPENVADVSVKEPEPVEAAVEEPVVAMPKQEALAAFCKQWNLDQPTYGETPPNAPNARPVAACTMKYKDAKGKFVKISLNDSGRTLAEATEKAAAKMLKKLEKQISEAVAAEKKQADVQPVSQPVEADNERAEAVAASEEKPLISAVEDAVVTTDIAETVEPDAPITGEEIIETPPEEAVAAVEEVTALPEETVLPAETPLSDAGSSDVEPVAEAAESEKEDAVPLTEPEQAVEEPTVEVVSAEVVPVEEFIQQTIVLPGDEVPSEEATPPAQETKPVRNTRKKKTEATDESTAEEKPVKTKRTTTRSSSKKKTAPAEDANAENMLPSDVSVAPAEASAPETGSEASGEPVAKPRTRKPRAKKVVETVENTAGGETTSDADSSQ